MTSDTRLTLLPTSCALFACADTSPFKTATRFSGNNAHDFILLVLPQEATRKIYGDVAPLLKKNLGIIRRWSPREQIFYHDFLEPPVPETAQRAWFLAKTLEILS